MTIRWKEISTPRTRGIFALVALAGLASGAPGIRAQVAPPTLHGHVTRPDGSALPEGIVKLTKDKTEAAKDRKYPFSFPVSATGDYSGTAVPGEYVAVVFQGEKTIDYLEVSLKFGVDTKLDFDMTREEYLKTLTPEAKAAIAEAKSKNAGVVAYNNKVVDINKTLIQARADNKAGKIPEALAAMQGLVQQKPDEALLWITLGDVQLNDAKTSRRAAISAKTSPMDVAVVQKFSAAATSYQKGIDFNAKASKPSPEISGPALMNLGDSLALSGKTKEAVEAYDAAVKAQPALAAGAYYNEAANFYNMQKMEDAAVAADKAIAADPKKADAYYIKAQSLVQKAAVDPKTNKIVAPPGCIESYQMYLELEPDGPRAKDVKEVLTGFGQPIKNSYRKK